MTAIDYRTSWLANTLRSHDEVASASALNNGHVRVVRRELPTITVAPIATPRIDEAIVEAILDRDIPTVIALVPKASHYDWTARELAESEGSTIHTIKELYGAMALRDPRPYIDRHVAYNLERLTQHRKVAAVEMICEASMLVTRRGSLSDVIVAVEYEYELTEEAVVRALKRHPDADALLNANPNGRATGAALEHAEHAGIGVFNIAGLMSGLHHDALDT